MRPDGHGAQLHKMRTLLCDVGPALPKRMPDVRHQDATRPEPGCLRNNGQPLSCLLSRSPQTKRASGPIRSLRIALTISLLFLAAHVVAGGAEESPAETDAGPPPLLAIGGAQDVWPFSFGLNATFADVEAALGTPQEVIDEPAEGAGPAIIRWVYPGLIVTFLAPSPTRVQILTVRFAGPQYPLKGGLELGMPAERARQLMGEPRVVSDESEVWFYSTTTIELVVSEGRVRSVQVARALP